MNYAQTHIDRHTDNEDFSVCLWNAMSTKLLDPVLTYIDIFHIPTYLVNCFTKIVIYLLANYAITESSGLIHFKSCATGEGGWADYKVIYKLDSIILKNDNLR